MKALYYFYYLVNIIFFFQKYLKFYLLILKNYLFLYKLGATEALNDNNSPVTSIFDYNYAKKTAYHSK